MPTAATHPVSVDAKVVIRGRSLSADGTHLDRVLGGRARLGGLRLIATGRQVVVSLRRLRALRSLMKVGLRGLPRDRRRAERLSPRAHVIHEPVVLSLHEVESAPQLAYGRFKSSVGVLCPLETFSQILEGRSGRRYRSDPAGG